MNRYRRFSALLPLLLTSCSLLELDDDSLQEPLKTACGEQCLINGERCSQFFTGRIQQDRLLQDRAIRNYRICLRKFPANRPPETTPCIPPVSPETPFDDCGEQLDRCLEACGTTLEETAESIQLKREKAQAAQADG